MGYRFRYAMHPPLSSGPGRNEWIVVGAMAEGSRGMGWGRGEKGVYNNGRMCGGRMEGWIDGWAVGTSF